MTKIKIAGSDRVLWVAVFSILAAGLIILGVLYYNYNVVRLQDEKYGEISAIARLKFDSLLDWRKHRLADVRRASLGPLVRKEISNFLNDTSNNASKAVLKLQLNINRKTNVYADALFLDKSGAMLLSDTPDPPPIDKATKIAVEIAFKERKEVMSDFFRSPKDIIYVDAVAPVYDSAGSIMAFMILRSNAADYLFPLIQSWPTPSKTAETLLVRRDGDFVLFLNELRHMQNTALTLRMPVTTENLTAAQAIFGKYGRFHGKDYRGVDVLAMILPVPETGWFMVAKVDSDEILSEVKYRAWVITLFVFLLIFILGGAVNVFYKNRNAADRKKADDALRKSEEKYRILFQTAAEGILVADIETKRFIYANPAICIMLGYSNEELISMGVEDIHPKGNLSHINGAFLALAKGEITKAPDIPCLRKDGRIIYADIAASAAVIDGRMCNVGFFMDIIERKRSEKKLQELHDLSMAIMSSSSLEEALRLCLDTAIRLSGLDSGGAYVINRSTGDLELITSTGLTQDFVNEVSHIPADSAGAHVVYGKLPVYVDYKTLGIKKTPTREKEGLRAISIIPIVRNDNVIACLNIASHTMDSISEESQTILEMVHASIGNTIGRIVTETALRESEERYRRISNSITDYIYTVRVKDGAAVETKHAPGCHAVTGYNENEFAEDPFLWIRMVAPEDRSMVEEQAKRILAGQVTSPIEHRIIHKNGMMRWVSNTSVPHYDEHGILVSYDGLIQNITKRKQAEEAMRESEERYRIAIESANDGVTIVQNDVHVYVNPEFLNIFGYDSLEEIVGKPRTFIVYPDYREQVNAYGKARERGDYAPQRYEFKGIKKDGRIIDIEVSVNTIVFKGEKATLVYMRNITERKLAEKALRESEARLDAIIQGSPMPQFVIDKEHRVTHWNDALEKYSGIKAEEIVGTNQHWMAFYKKKRPCMADLLVDDKIENIQQWYEGKYANSKFIEGGYEATDFFAGMGRSGTWLYFTAVPIRDADGSIIGAIETLEDITERKLAEEALRESEEIFSQFMQHSPIYVFFKDERIRSLRLSNNYEKMLGRPLTELLGKTMDDLFPSDFAKKMIEDDIQILTEGKEITFEEEFDGRYYTTIKFPIYIENKPPLLAGYTIDVTEHMQAQDTLIKEKEKFYTYLENAPFGMVLITQDGMISYINQKFKEIMGYEPVDLPDGITWFRKAYPDADYRHEVISAWEIDLEKRMIGEQIPRVFVAVCKDGSKKTINFITVLIASGEYLMACEDITLRLQAEEEKRKLEERLTRAEKMEALGTLAGGVAHDLNNVLGVLIGYAELLFDEKDESSRKEFLTNILDGGRRAAAMVEDMLTMTRRGVTSRDVLNLNNFIVEYERSPELESLINAHASIDMKINLDPDLLNISGSRVHLEKMLFNLILNAFEAMPNGGSLTINTANYYLEKPIIGYDEVRQGEYVVLSISDTGIGIKPEDLKRIFEPFYTKKIMGRSGTGLGLAVVWGTVKDHNGYINVKSEEGNGSTFALYFPVSREEITANSVSVSIAEYMGKGESILVVDDIKGQRDLSAEMLKKLNYKVTVVASGEEAVEHLKKRPVDLILLDMIMDPGIDGLDTYKKILEIRPKQKAIIVSGFSETDRVDEAQAAGAGAYVKKPYVIEKLGLAVRNELDRRA